MNLVIDSGNSRLKYGLFKDRNLVENGFLASNEINEIISKNDVCNLIFSSVTNQEFPNYDVKVPFLLLNYATPLPIEIAYKTPHLLGVDRIAAAVGAQALYKGSDVLNIDTGTCIKFNMINNEGKFLGGAISPGILMRYKALNNYTDKLPLLNPNFDFYKLIGETTEESLHSGVLMGVLAEVEQLIYQYQKLFPRLKVIVSGGDTDFLAKHFKNRIFAEPNLVLIGLNEILLYNIF